MTLKNYMKESGIKISELSRSTGIPYTTVSDVVNGKTDIDNVSVKVFMKLSKALELPMSIFYELAKGSTPTPELNNGYTLNLKNDGYYIDKDNESHFLCKNTPLNTFYIKEIAGTFIKNAEKQKRMDSWQTML